MALNHTEPDRESHRLALTVEGPFEGPVVMTLESDLWPTFRVEKRNFEAACAHIANVLLHAKFGSVGPHEDTDPARSKVLP